MNKHVLNISEFYSLNESKCLSKKDMGMIGPLPTGDLKIKIPVDNKDFTRQENNDFYVFEFGNHKVEMPKKCVDISTQPGFDVATFKTAMNWFKSPQNSENFENIIEGFLQSKYDEVSKKISLLEEDVNLITDEIGIENDVESYECDSDLTIDGTLSNGMEFEYHKSSPQDPLKKIFIWGNSDDIHPSIEIKRRGSKFDCKYRTPKGVFDCKHDALSSIQQSPVDKYLISVCSNKKNDELQKELVEHLFKLFKYHNWEKPEAKTDKMERYVQETNEIKRVMEMLKNSIPEKHLEEMYTDARARFISKK